jgi:DNA processing protein
VERDELAAWLRLSLTPGVGNSTARKLLAAFGLPDALFAQSTAALAQVVSRAQTAALLAQPAELPSLLESTWNWLCTDDAVAQRRIVVLGDVDYPASLLNIEDPPLMLYLQGAGILHETPLPGSPPPAVSASNLIANSCRQSIAIVGSRNPTPQGLENARAFARALSGAGLTVVSGLALGIDGAAHRGALEGMDGMPTGAPSRFATIAVVGTGLDRVYPKGHRALAHAITQRGLIVSEYPIGTPPLAENFPKRNRLIAGLAQGTLVVEAALKSGSLITARLAAEQGKEVFAIPGSIHAIQSHGCHALIRQGAKLVESAQDVLEDMKLEDTTVLIADKAGVAKENAAIDTKNPLLEALGHDPVSLDALQARTGMDTPALQAQLMTLELDDLVARLPGGLFQRLFKA